MAMLVLGVVGSFIAGPTGLASGLVAGALIDFRLSNKHWTSAERDD